MAMKTIFVIVIVTLVMTAILLGISLMMPTKAVTRLTFEQVMELSQEKINQLSEITIKYEVNVSEEEKDVIGTAEYTRKGSLTSFKITPELKNYEGTALILNPDSVINFLTRNHRSEYSGELVENNRTCNSVIVQPNSTTRYKKIIDGDYIVIACMDKIIGYPTTIYSGEVNNERVIYSKLIITELSFKQ